MAIDLEALRAELAGLGLLLRGVLPADETTLGRPAVGSLLVLGNVGGALWENESGGYAKPVSAENPHPLDSWTKTIVDPLAARLGGEAFYPFGGPPWHPFQRWAMASEPVTPSPIGMLIHPDYGLWHAYRAAILVPEMIAPFQSDERQSPCLACDEQPCLSTCPVDAFTDMRGEGGGYDVPSCAAHIATPGGVDCLTQGCRARRACPVGGDYHYAPGQAEFHMQSFLRARG